MPIQQAEHYGHDGWEVYESMQSQKKYFVFKDTVGFGSGLKRDIVVLQVLTPYAKFIPNPDYKEGKDLPKKIKEVDMTRWHFTKRYNPGQSKNLQRVTWPPQLNKEVAQAIANCGGDVLESKMVSLDDALADIGG